MGFKAIFGLGNIGAEYELTRHNMGFMVLDHLAAMKGAVFKTDKYLHGSVARISLAGQETLLVKPTTLMNLSGLCVVETCRRVGIEDPESEILVVNDDVWLDFGTASIKKKGTDGGNNGLASIINTIGTTRFVRLKIGIKNEHMGPDLARFVLARFNAEESQRLEELSTKLARVVERVAQAGVDLVANEINRKQLLDNYRDKKEE